MAWTIELRGATVLPDHHLVDAKGKPLSAAKISKTRQAKITEEHAAIVEAIYQAAVEAANSLPGFTGGIFVGDFGSRPIEVTPDGP